MTARALFLLILTASSIPRGRAVDVRGFESITGRDPTEDLETMNDDGRKDIDVSAIFRRMQQNGSSDDSSWLCYSKLDPKNPDRYCNFNDAPRQGTFLKLSCPTSKGEDLTKCGVSRLRLCSTWTCGSSEGDRIHLSPSRTTPS